MTAAPGMAARMAGAMVAVVVAASPGTAAAEDALPMPFPEAADKDAIDAVVVPSDGEGSALGDVPVETVPVETVPAEVVPAGTVPVEAVSAEAAAGREAGAVAGDAPDRGSMDRAEAAPAPASRLLRALAEAQTAPASPDDGAAGGVLVPGTSVPGTSVSGTRVYAAEGCPRALLRRLLAGAADDAGALTALGIEREVLTLCRERQEIVTGLFETEARLRELRAAAEPTVPAKTAAAVPAPAQPVREIAAFRQARPSALRAALAASAETLAPETLVPEKANEGDTRAGEAQAPAGVSPARVSPARVSPRYAWFSIIGTSGSLRAGVTDGTGVWFVREGDALPGGSVVAAIAARPPAVRVSAPGETGEETSLPYRTGPGGRP